MNLGRPIRMETYYYGIIKMFHQPKNYKFNKVVLYKNLNDRHNAELNNSCYTFE